VGEPLNQDQEHVMSTSSIPSAGAAVTGPQLLDLGNSALDELFRASPAGPIPDGFMRGTVLAFPGTRLAKPLAVLTYYVGWQGKVFDARRGVLANKITPFRLRAVVAKVDQQGSWVDGKPCVALDYSRTSLLARMVRDEIRQIAPSHYLGVVWLRRRRVAWFALRAYDDRLLQHPSTGT
jgi:hypothetical protein